MFERASPATGRILSLALAAALTACAAPTPSTDTDALWAVTRVTVIPMDGNSALLEDRTVLIRGERIEAVAPTAELELPPGTETIDGRGKFLLPSLVDSHVHVDDPGDLTVLLAHGIGAVRNMEGLPYHVQLREAIERGALRGPRFFTCGPYTNAPRIESAAAAREEVAAQARAGYDCVKIHGDLSPETLSALGEAASEAGLPLIGHVPRNLELTDVLATGAMQEIAHAEEYLYTYFAHRPREGWDDAIDEAVEATRRAGVAVTPTLTTYRSIGAQVRDLDAELARIPLELVGPFARRNFRPDGNRYRRKFEEEDAEWLDEYLVVQQRLVVALSEAGVPLLTGTDTNSPVNVPGDSLHEELELLVETGLPSDRVLRAATVTGWRRVSGRDDVGAVVPGMLAELLLVEANPLDDVANTRKVAGIVVRGEWLPASTLEAEVESLVTEYRREQPFVDLLWDNTIDDGLAYYRERKAEDPETSVFRPGTMACQAMRAMRDGAPETAQRAVQLGLEEYPSDAFLASVQGWIDGE